MTREFEPDPEVLADLRLRAQTERERPRTESQVRAVYAWKPSPVVGKWKCRTPPCTHFVDVTEEAMERWAQCNAWLRAEGQEPLDTSTILRCDVCEREMRRVRAGKLRERVDNIAGLIRRLKDSANPRGEVAIVKQLREWRHPDVDGLLQALDGKSSTRKGKAHL